MKKTEYLALPEVACFLDYFKDIAFGEKNTFCQNYKQFSVSCFKEAFEQYTWEKKDFATNHEILTKLSRQLKKNLKKSDNGSVLVYSLKVLDWGGVVNRASVRWLVDSYEAGQICKNINSATTILGSNDDTETTQFKGNLPLRSDSATTKIFSLAGDKSIIYDNRVGAALGRIVRAHLESIGANSLPDHLNFMRGSDSTRDKKRNPSTKNYTFRKKEAGYLHALSNIRASWLVQEIVKDKRFEKHFCCPAKTTSNKLRIVEAALFMIGNDLTKIDKIEATAKKTNKKTKAKNLFVKSKINGLTPRQTKDAFMNDVGLTEKGANTYYYNFKNGTW